MKRKKNPLEAAKQLFTRAGKNLPKQRKKILELTKEELRIIFGR